MGKPPHHFYSNYALALFSLAVLCGMQISTQSGSAESKPDVRTLKFPTDHSVGGLDLIEKPAKHVTGKHQVAMCKGTVTVTVPPSYVLLLAVNQYVVLHPERLLDVAPAGIDAVKITFMSMDENEDGLCDKALKFLPHFTDAFRLDVSESDASDAGIDTIKTMPKLKCLWAYASSVRGSCLKTIDRFPLLEEIDLSRCVPFHQSDLQYLSKLRNLTMLQLDNSAIDKVGVKALAGCKNLEYLDLERNKKITDDCLPLLLSLKNLHYLNLQGTEVTVEGLKVLAPLKLKTLSLSINRFNQNEFERIGEELPHTVIHRAKPREAKTDSKIIFTPILGHNLDR